MTKILFILLLLVMIAHIIRPIGLPGLRRRADFWKIAIIAIIGMAVAVVFQF